MHVLNDITEWKEKNVIHGGITASDLVGLGIPHETVAQKAKECVDICAPGGNFIVMLSECGDRAPLRFIEYGTDYRSFPQGKALSLPGRYEGPAVLLRCLATEK